MTSVWELANPQLRDLAVYEPGKPIEETARELGVDPSTIIKLASNENPLGPSPKALQAMRAAAEHVLITANPRNRAKIKPITIQAGLSPRIAKLPHSHLISRA